MTAIQKLANSFRSRGRRDWQVLLLSLLLAFTVWFIYNMSAEYSAFLEYELVAESSIEGYSSSARASTPLVFRGKATGFYILGHRLSHSAVKVVNIPSSLWSRNPQDDEMFILYEDALKEILPQITEDKVRLEYMVTNRLEFTFQKESCKKVPVIPNAVIRCAPQYMVTDDIMTVPDSVLVYGTEDELSRVSSVHTETIYLEGLTNGKDGVARIKSGASLRISEESVKYSLIVSRYVEMTKVVNVGVDNLPKGRSAIIIPSQAKITYRVPFPFHGGDMDLSVHADYEDYINESLSGQVILRLVSVPEEIISYRIDPAVAEIIIRE